MPCRHWIALLLIVGAGHAVTASPGPPAIRWRQAIPGWGQPAADETTAFVLTRRHEIAALDLATGAVRWRADTGGPGDAPLGSAVRLAGRSVIVGDDAVAAFDRATGRPAWRFVPAHGRSPGVFLGDTVGGLVLAGSLSGDVYAIDVATGSLGWHRRVATPDTTAVYPPVVVGGERVVVAYTEFGGGRLAGGLAAFALDGTPQWTRRLPPGLGASGGAVSDGGVVIVAATDGSIRAFSVRDGTPRWRLAPSSGTTATSGGRDIRALALAGRLLIAGSLNGELAAYDLRTRQRRWRYRGGPDGAAALRLTADATHVFAPYTDGSLVAVSLSTGKERWRTDATPDALEWPPVARGPHLIAAGSRGVVALDTATQSPAAARPRPEEER